MQINRNSRMAVGDWVKGKTRNGALLHGYLEKVHAESAKAEMKVVDSDNVKIIGNTVRVDKNSVQKLDSLTGFTESQLQDLIDIALENKDEKWFMELSAELNEKRKANKDNAELYTIYKKDYQNARY